MAQPLQQALIRLGLSQACADFCIGEYEMNTLEAWTDVAGDPDLSQLQKLLRSPGGVMQVQVQGPGGVAMQQNVPHSGFRVSPTTMGNLRIMQAALKHHRFIQRTVVPDDITMAWINQWKFLIKFRKKAADNKPVEADLPKIQMNDWPQTKENIVEYFGGVFGEEAIPLGYILRKDEEVPPEADDPVANYDGDHQAELIARAPLTGETFREDNRTMCRLLKMMCVDTAAYTYISAYTANGRAAWLKLVEVYLGPQHTQTQATIYEAKLQNSHYDGESARFTFDKLIDMHKQAHTRLDGLKPHGYLGMDEQTKIRHLLNAIRTKNTKVQAAVELVRNNAAYATFDQVARRIKDTIVIEHPTKTPGYNRKIAAVGKARNDDKDIMPGVEADMQVEDKYYPKPEWNKLSPGQKKGVLLKREQRGSTAKRKNRNGKPKGSETVINKQWKKKIAAMERKIAALSTDKGSESEEETPEETPASAKKQKSTNSNRNHPALRGPGQ